MPCQRKALEPCGPEGHSVNSLVYWRRAIGSIIA